MSSSRDQSTVRPTATASTSLNAFRCLLTSPKLRIGLLIAGSIVLIFVAWLGFRKIPTTTFDLTRHSIPLDQLVDGGPGKDGIPAILAPKFISAPDATFLHDDDRVLGLTAGTEAKAYPIKILNWHEIVNDTLGDKAVVVTYCPLCGTGMAFEAEIHGRRHTFGVSGLLYQSDLLMYDHQTESLWSQIGMQAVTGPLTGEKLIPMFLDHTIWKDWRTAHPSTVVLSTKTGSFRNYDRDPYAGYGESSDLLFDTTRIDSRYHPKEWVVGLEVDGVTKAYSFLELNKVSSPLVDRVNGRHVTVRFKAESRSASVADANGTPIPSVMAFWFAWYAFHPNTLVYTAP